MSLEDDLHSRAAKLERRISSFRIQNPQGFVTGGFGSLKRGAQDIGERINNIEKSVAGFNLSGDFVEVSGNFKSGFALNAAPGTIDSGETTTPGGGGGDETGACCFDDFCDIETETDCVDGGGEFRGVDTTCEDVDICPVAPCCFQIGDFFACDTRGNETSCTNDGGTFISNYDLSCVPNPCECPDPVTYSVFDVQLRIYGNVNFRYCDLDCITGIDDSQSVDFTVNLTDNGDGSADFTADSGHDFACGASDTSAQAFLTCCRSSCSFCAHSEIWDVEIFINMFFCNNGGTACGGDPDAEQLSEIEASVWDPDCEFNATRVPIQLGVYPFPNGTYSGTTSFTEQGTFFGLCDSRPPVGGGSGILGDLSIDWQVTIAP